MNPLQLRSMRPWPTARIATRHARVPLALLLLGAPLASTAGGGGPVQAGIGAKYGTRDPHRCPDRKQPTRGAPTPTQAAAYVTCDLERESGAYLYLMSDVRVTGIAKARRYNPNEDINMPNIDVTAPVYAIRGSLTRYQCDKLITPGLLKSGFKDNRGANCDASDQPNAKGVCYKDTFGDWSCGMLDVATASEKRRGVAPPSA